MKMMNFTKIAFRNLFSKPATKLYPNVPMEVKPGARGHIENEITSCIFCGICSRRCPTSCITVDRTAKVWEIERFGCLACGLCVEACPKKCLAMKEQYTSPKEEKYTDRYEQKVPVTKEEAVEEK